MRTSGGETCIEKIGSSTSVGNYAKIGVVDNYYHIEIVIAEQMLHVEFNPLKSTVN